MTARGVPVIDPKSRRVVEKEVGARVVVRVGDVLQIDLRGPARRAEDGFVGSKSVEAGVGRQNKGVLVISPPVAHGIDAAARAPAVQHASRPEIHRRGTGCRNLARRPLASSRADRLRTGRAGPERCP